MQAPWEQAAVSPPDLRAITDAAIITLEGYSRDSQPQFSTFPLFLHEKKWQGSQQDTFVVPVCRNN